MVLGEGRLWFVYGLLMVFWGPFMVCLRFVCGFLGGCLWFVYGFSWPQIINKHKQIINKMAPKPYKTAEIFKFANDLFMICL